MNSEETCASSNRMMASIRRIREIRPIEGADKIELAIVSGWQCVTAKDNGFKVGDLCVYCEIDSILPEHPEFEFLRDRKFRIKTLRIRGQLSQGLILPIDVLHSFSGNLIPWAEGDDVTDVIGVTKYEVPMPACLSGIARGNFPTVVPRTDENRVQNLVREIHTYKCKDLVFVGTEKIDGSSCSMMILNNEFQVCSRNLNLKEFDDTLGTRTTESKNSLWRIARELDIESKIREYCRKHDIKEMSIQGELIGEGIQGNKYKLKGQHYYLFNAFDVDAKRYFDWYKFSQLIQETGLNQVPVLYETYHLNYDTINDLLKISEGKSALNNNTEREGIVFKTKYDASEIDGNSYGKISFKVINNKFLTKYGED